MIVISIFKEKSFSKLHRNHFNNYLLAIYTNLVKKASQRIENFKTISLDIPLRKRIKYLAYMGLSTLRGNYFAESHF